MRLRTESENIIQRKNLENQELKEENKLSDDLRTY
jgi:hypothetical protein